MHCIGCGRPVTVRAWEVSLRGGGAKDRQVSLGKERLKVIGVVARQCAEPGGRLGLGF